MFAIFTGKHMGCPAVMAVKLKEHLQINLYFPNYL